MGGGEEEEEIDLSLDVGEEEIVASGGGNAMGKWQCHVSPESLATSLGYYEKTDANRLYYLVELVHLSAQSTIHNCTVSFFICRMWFHHSQSAMIGQRKRRQRATSKDDSRLISSTIFSLVIAAYYISVTIAFIVTFHCPFPIIEDRKQK